MIRWKKNSIGQIFHQQKIQKVLMKIDKMADVFLNSANFAQHALLTLAPPNGYILYSNALIKVSKVNWTSQLLYKILWSSSERKYKKDKLHFSQKTLPKSPHRLELKFSWITKMCIGLLILLGLYEWLLFWIWIFFANNFLK